LAWVRALVAQGQARFEAQPLVGLRLALEALALAPDGDVELRTSIESVIDQLAGRGRVSNIGEDVRRLSASADGLSVVVDRSQGADEVRHTADHQLLDNLPADVDTVFLDPELGSATFVISYTPSISAPAALKGEIRRTRNGSLVETLGHSVKKVYFGPPMDSPVFVLDYYDVPDELHRSSDGRVIRQLDGAVKAVTFGRALSAAVLVVMYEDGSAELIRAVDGETVSAFADKIESVRFSPDPAASLLGIRYSTGPAEVRRSLDGSLVTTLTTKVANFYFGPSPNAAVFVVDNQADKGELRRTTDGSRVMPLPGEVVRVLFGSTPDDPAFVIHYKDVPGEIRRVADGSLIKRLPGIVGFGKVSSDPAGLYLVTFYSGTLPADIRYMATGELVRTFSDRVSDVDFSPDASFMIVDYSRAPDQIIRTVDGLVLASLDGEVVNVTFSPNARYFVVDYENGRSELWAARPAPHRLLDMELGRAEYAVDVNRQRMMVRYSDGRAYLVDLGWLEAMGGNPNALSLAEVTDIACHGPLADPLFDEHELDLYLKGQPALACR
jgi:WD40 repeat protein